MEICVKRGELHGEVCEGRQQPLDGLMDPCCTAYD